LNTDQGSQFTGTAFVDQVQQHGIQVSMDGKGSWRDNVFVERLWKSVKYEEVYLHAYDSVAEARQGLQRYFSFYNQLDVNPAELHLKTTFSVQLNGATAFIRAGNRKERCRDAPAMGRYEFVKLNFSRQPD
jgi:hypothetical protein